MPETILRITDLHKSFGPVKALRGVELAIYPGEVHALIGENGAGKSTLMKTLSGVHQPDKGKMTLMGKIYRPTSPLDGRVAGISMIYQELNLAPHLSVEENITLGTELHKWGWLHSQKQTIRQILIELGQMDISPDDIVKSLSIGKQQIVEIGRALLTNAKIVVMDEPTSSLSAADTQALFQVISKLRDRGVAVIYISHFLEEVKEIGDRYTVLRDGETVATGKVVNTSISQLIGHMVGRSVDELYPSTVHTIGEVLLEAEALKGSNGLPVDASFTLRKGEILGIAGLVGSGRSEMVRTLFGLEKAEAGTLTLSHHRKLKVKYVRPYQSLAAGINLLSENRKEEGLALNLSILHNITLSDLAAYKKWGFIDLQAEYQAGEKWVEKLKVKTQNPHQTASALSGGNQQKVCIARLLHQDSDILILDEPTRGIDIGSKAEIYRLIQQLAQTGKAIIVISSYLPELFGICDTLAVMYKGRLSSIYDIDFWDEHQVMQYATSGEIASEPLDS